MDETTKLIHYTNGGPWFEEYRANHPHAPFGSATATKCTPSPAARPPPMPHINMSGGRPAACTLTHG